MKLKDIFNDLTAGEFSQLSIGGTKLGEIQEDHYLTVTSHITLGLTALYRRFNLRRGVITLELQPDQEIYPLESKYAVSNTKSREGTKYILDSDYAFKDDIIKIDGVKQAGRDVPLNDALASNSIHTLRGNVIRVPAELISNIYREPELTITYRANHPPLIVNGVISPETTEIELDPAYIQALLYFVASRAHNPMGTGASEFNAGNNWATKYERECQQLVLDNATAQAGSDSSTQTKFECRGFV